MRQPNVFETPFSFGYDFVVNKPFTFNAVKYSHGQAFPHDGNGERIDKEAGGVDERVAFKFYKQRLIYPLMQEGVFGSKQQFDAAVAEAVAAALAGGAVIPSVEALELAPAPVAEGELERDDTDLADDFEADSEQSLAGLSSIAEALPAIAADPEAVAANEAVELDDAPGGSEAPPPPAPASEPAPEAPLTSRHEGFGKWTLLRGELVVAKDLSKADAALAVKNNVAPQGA
jgi:hypothetical protein